MFFGRLIIVTSSSLRAHIPTHPHTHPRTQPRCGIREEAHCEYLGAKGIRVKGTNGRSITRHGINREKKRELSGIRAHIKKTWTP
jgi:hypothetical protein